MMQHLQRWPLAHKVWRVGERIGFRIATEIATTTGFCMIVVIMPLAAFNIVVLISSGWFTILLELLALCAVIWLNMLFYWECLRLRQSLEGRLMDAIQADDLKEVEEVIQAGPTCINCTDSKVCVAFIANLSCGAL
jgi:hypothetical protein